MKTKNILLILMIVTGVIMMCNSCGTNKKANPETQNSQDTVIRAKAVRIERISEMEISRDVDYPANLIANEEVYLAPSIPGRIIKINVVVGDRVSAGQLLIQMDPTQLNTVELQLLSLEKDMERFDTLIKYGSIPQQQYDQFKTQIDITRKNYELLKTNTNLVSPFSGIVTGKYFENGELFSGAPNTAVGKAAIVIIQQTNPIKAVISMSEKYYPAVKNGMNIDMTTEIYPNETFAGKINLIHPTINSATKTFNVEIQIPNHKEQLRPGMYARVKMELGRNSALVIPANAVLQQLGTNIRYIFLYKDGIAERINVLHGKRFDDQIEVVSDKIKAGDYLIVTGHGNLENGAKVEAVEGGKN